MSDKTAKKAAGEAVSNDATAGTANQETALTITGDGDVSGSLMLALSQSGRDEALRQFMEELHRVQEGFGDLTAPGDVYKMDRPFDVVDATTIPDFVDRKTGEVKVKHIFKLQFPEGDIKMVMQSNAGPRATLASLFASARLLGERITAGPYRFAQKDTGQIQPAYIFVQQAGFAVRPRAAAAQMTA